MNKVLSIGFGILISSFIFWFLSEFVFQFISYLELPGFRSGGGTHPFFVIALIGILGFIFIPLAITFGVIFGLFISKHMTYMMVGWSYWKRGLMIGILLSIVFIALEYLLLGDQILDIYLDIIAVTIITLPCILLAFIFGKIKGVYEKKTRSKKDVIDHSQNG